MSAVVATALVLIAVFVPVAFFPGTTGRLYAQFSMTIAFAVALSAFNALTLTPALSALLLERQTHAKGRFFQFFERLISSGTHHYIEGLKKAMGLGCGDPRQIEIVGDQSAAAENWHFVGPFKKMTFASRMQHKIYWGPMKKPIEWSLKTVLAPWAYIASVLYHDSFWYPVNAKRMMQNALESPWGRLFRNWERLTPTADGFPDVGAGVPEITLTGGKALVRSIGILGTCIAQAPEFVHKKRPAE